MLCVIMCVCVRCVVCRGRRGEKENVIHDVESDVITLILQLDRAELKLEYHVND